MGSMSPRGHSQRLMSRMPSLFSHNTITLHQGQLHLSLPSNYISTASHDHHMTQISSELYYYILHHMTQFYSYPVPWPQNYISTLLTSCVQVLDLLPAGTKLKDIQEFLTMVVQERTLLRRRTQLMKSLLLAEHLQVRHIQLSTVSPK